MRILYFDCFSGISGDMAVGSLVDLGVDPAVIENGLKKLDMETEYRLQWSKVVKNGISATKFDVELPSFNPRHGGHQHRHYRDIVQMIQNAGFNENVTDIALSIFEKIGKAEAKIHHVPLEEVHFHEVGAVDSILDILAVAIAVDHLRVDRILSSPVPVGGGTIRIEHGTYPVPAPATLEILKGIPIAGTDLAEELTTPTGAAVLAVLADEFGPFPPLKVESIGYGAGTKDFPAQPNVLRVILGTRE